MICKRLVRVLPVFALTASLSYATFYAKDVTLTFNGHDMVLTDVDGARLSHELTHVVQQGGGKGGPQQKSIGKPKFEDIKVSMGVSQFDPIMLDMLNSSLRGYSGGKYGLELDGPKGMKLNFTGIQPHRIVTPGFDSDDSTCTDWSFDFGFLGSNGYPGMFLMKAKEKANRTKCGNNLRLIVNDNGKPRTFDVNSSEPVETILIEADLDGDGEFDAMDVNTGNLVVFLPAVQFGYFQEWMRMSGENPLYEGNHKDAALRVQTDRFGSLEFDFAAMQPMSVAKMADGSVRVEFCTSGEQLKANPRH